MKIKAKTKELSVSDYVLSQISVYDAYADQDYVMHRNIENTQNAVARLCEVFTRIGLLNEQAVAYIATGEVINDASYGDYLEQVLVESVKHGSLHVSETASMICNLHQASDSTHIATRLKELAREPFFLLCDVTGIGSENGVNYRYSSWLERSATNLNMCDFVGEAAKIIQEIDHFEYVTRGLEHEEYKAIARALWEMEAS